MGLWSTTRLVFSFDSMKASLDELCSLADRAHRELYYVDGSVSTGISYDHEVAVTIRDDDGGFPRNEFFEWFKSIIDHHDGLHLESALIEWDPDWYSDDVIVRWDAFDDRWVESDPSDPEYLDVIECYVKSGDIHLRDYLAKMFPDAELVE